MGRRSGALAVMAGLTGLALATHLPQLWGVPAFGVEWEEVAIAYRIAFEHLRPATDYGKDIGPLFNYIVAAGFRLVGPSLLLPRLITLAAGVLTVPVTYLIGREAYDEATGKIAAVMLAFSGAGIFLSHEAFSDALTPLAVALAGLATLLADRRGSLWLIPAGFLWAMALESDSSVLAILVPLAVYLAWMARRRPMATLAGVGAFVLGYAHMILLNIRQPLISLNWILERKGYAVGQSHTLVQIALNYLEEALGWGQTLASSFPVPLSLIWVDALGLVFVIVWLDLFARAVWAKRGDGSSRLLLVLSVGPLLVIPLVNQAYLYPQMSRYLVPVLPFALILAARYGREVLASISAPHRRLALAAATTMAVIWPAFSLTAYEGAQVQTRGGNAQALTLIERSRTLAGANGQVYLDSTGYRARWLRIGLLSDGLRPITVGDPWARGLRGVFLPSEWRRILAGSSSPRLVLLSRLSFLRLRSDIPPAAGLSSVGGPGGGYVIVRLPARRGAGG